MTGVMKSLTITGYQIHAHGWEKTSSKTASSWTARHQQASTCTTRRAPAPPPSPLLLVIIDFNKNRAAWMSLCAGGFEVVIVEGEEVMR